MSETIKNNIPQEIAPKLEALYSQLPEWKNILAAVKDGENKFIANIQKMGLDKFGINTSKVHNYSDIEPQAFIVGIPSKESPQEISTKSYFVYGAHWIDDFFDNPDFGAPFDQLLEDRHDIKKALINMGRVGQVGFLLAEKALHPEGAYNGLGRMLYGGLVQRSDSAKQRALLLREYQDLGVRLVDDSVAKEIRKIQPEAYWMTNKTVMEFMNAAEPVLDFTVAELWNLIYAPALYYHDIMEEKQRGESSFDKDEQPRDEEMAKMIKIGAKYLSQFPDKRLNLRMEQLRFLLSAFRKTLPDVIVSEYKLIIENS